MGGLAESGKVDDKSENLCVGMSCGHVNSMNTDIKKIV
jgi:hypothetical protein